MQHTNSIVIHRNESGDAQIWILDYENGKQVGETREIPENHVAYPSLLAAIRAVTDGGGIPVEGHADATPVDTGALAKAVVDSIKELIGLDDTEIEYSVAQTRVKLEIERALAGIESVEDEAHASESVESAAVSNEDITDTQPLSASE